MRPSVEVAEGERPLSENRVSLEGEAQRLVNAHFQSASRFWTEIYERGDMTALICQRRRDTALAWVDELCLPTGSRILEVGCGAGLMAVELARKGFSVDATDPVPEMVELSRRHGDEANVSGSLRTTINDAHALAFDGHSFDAVIALGVIPWLRSPQTALCEMSRVLKPGGHLIATVNNLTRLNYLIDPKYSPALRPLRRVTKRLIGHLGVPLPRGGPPSRLHSRRGFDALLSAAGMQTLRCVAVGFGPFTFWGRRLLPEELELRVNALLQRSADRGHRGIRSLGAQYLVLAHKLAHPTG